MRGDLTQKVFAEKLGVHTNTVSRWERGEQIPDQEDLCNILAVFCEVSPEWLLTGNGFREKSTPNFDKISENENKVRSPESEASIFDSLGMVEGMGLLTKIYSAADPVYIRAINANLMAFANAVESKTVAQDMEKRLQDMEAKLAEMDELKRYVLELKIKEEASEKARLGEQSSKRKVA